MPRWKDRLKLLFGIAATAVAVAGAYFWHRSYAIPDALVRIDSDRQYTRVLSSDGVLSWQTARNCPADPLSWIWVAKVYNGTTGMTSTNAEPPAWEQIMVEDPTSWPLKVQSLGGPRTFASEAHVPYAALVLPAAALTAVWVVTAVRRRLTLSIQEKRKTHGACPRCGYDLRATPLRCPECGDDTM